MSTPPPMLFTGSANPALAHNVARSLATTVAPAEIERFPDGEIHVQLLEDPQGRDVFLVQPTSPPPDQHLFELLVLADACRRAGAARITAVIPYLGYARQERRAKGFEAVTARLVADLIVASGIGRLLTLDLHTEAIEGFFTVPVERLTSFHILAEAIRACRPANAVIVAPDLGAAKLADAYGRLLDLPVAIVHKQRTGPEAVAATRLSGDVQGKTPIVVDDMISTGGTIEAAMEAIVAAGADPEHAIVVASHGLFVGSCVWRLQHLKVKRIFVTDSVAQGSLVDLPIQVVSIADILADSIRRLR